MFTTCSYIQKLVLVLVYLSFTIACSNQSQSTAEYSEPINEWLNRCTDWDDWDKPAPPFRLYGNSYYVGTCGISAILITSTKGHVLIDGGTEAGATIIAENIETLGFSLKDVKILLHSHEHFDHVAGIAKLQRHSGALLLASSQAAPTLNSGVVAKNDPQSGIHEPFPAAKVNRIVKEGELVKLGDLALTPIATPGHTPGALSWQWKACEYEECVSIVYADSLSPVSSNFYRFSDFPKYIAEYRQGLQKLKAIDCQMLITPHPSASNMPKRLAKPDGLLDPDGCTNYSNKVSIRLDHRLQKEKSKE